MPPRRSLKRGSRRESCDLCYARKIRCDRAARRDRGHGACSQCDLRQLPCVLRSDDIRVPSHQRATPHHGQGDRGAAQSSPSRTFSLGGVAATASSGLGEHADDTVQDTAPWVDWSSHQAAPDTDMGFDWDGLDFQFNPDSTTFLDDIFTQDMEHADVTDSVSLDQAERGGDCDTRTLGGESYQIHGVDLKTLEASLEAYFDLANLALPILYRDAFMSDYKNKRASPASVCAIACRGCPFVPGGGQWSLQQTFAGHFREAFLQAREASGNRQRIRLDDLEALALMADFDYTERAGPSVQSQLGTLLLTHDSLVLMTIQYQMQTWSRSTTGQPVPLSRCEERKRLLFWHVYGRDAFRCLNAKAPSRIRDDDADVFEGLRGDVDKSYLDVVLGVAIVARRITQTFCNPAVRRRGVKVEDVEELYEQLERWRRSCPPRFSIEKGGGGAAGLRGEEHRRDMAGQPPPLHRVVIALLEHDCYMQVQDYVEVYGIDGRGSLQGTLLEARVDYETLRTACNVASLTEWLQLQRVRCRGSEYPLTDLAPDIVRDICAGTCFWLAERGRRLANPSAAAEMPGQGADLTRLRADGLARAATRLRDAAAAARSHRDTGRVLERLDQQLRSLREAVGDVPAGAE